MSDRLGNRVHIWPQIYYSLQVLVECGGVHGLYIACMYVLVKYYNYYCVLVCIIMIIIVLYIVFVCVYMLRMCICVCMCLCVRMCEFMYVMVYMTMCQCSLL